MTENQPSSNVAAKQPRRINGIVLLGLIALGFIVLNYRPAVSTVYCTEETLTPKPDVIMLGAWWCPYCYQARKYFQNHNISYCEYDIERTENGKKIYEQVNGRGIPVLLIGNYQLEGFDEQAIEALLSELHTP